MVACRPSDRSRSPEHDIDFCRNGIDTIEMAQAIGIAIIVLLVVIAVELLLIHRDILYLTAFRRSGESEGAGQTINVNVGPKDDRTSGPAAPGTAAIGESVLMAPAEAGRETEDAEAAEEDRKPVRIEPAAASRIATSSGLVAKRCSACGMENSSMRSECFNCGCSI